MRGPGAGNKYNERKGNDYTCLEEVTTDVVVIDTLPAGIGQTPQKLDQPIEIIKTKVIDVGDELVPREIFPVRMITQNEAEALVKSGKFTKAMVPGNPRRCRECDDVLPADRHWTCRKCLPQLPEEAGEYLYNGVSGE